MFFKFIVASCLVIITVVVLISCSPAIALFAYGLWYGWNHPHVANNETSFYSQPTEHQSSLNDRKSPWKAAVGKCFDTTVDHVGTRLMTQGTEDDYSAGRISPGSPWLSVPGSGSAIWYVDGAEQVSYETVDGVENSKAGDKVRLCVVEHDTTCDPTERRGNTYRATNFRTRESWTLSDSEHACPN